MTKNLLRWLLLIIQLHYSLCQNLASLEDEADLVNSKSREFSPRMDYDEWTPLGRGDPLKNDPTFDYVPPVLDRVHYWIDSHTTEPSYKRDILVLGVTAKKTSPKIPDQIIKITPLSDRNEFTGSSGAELPKIIRITNFRNAPTIEFRSQSKMQMPASYFPSPFYSQKPKPFTMMLPPPLVQKSVGNRVNPNFNHISNDQFVKYDNPGQLFSIQAEKDYENQQYYKSYPQYYSPKGSQAQYQQHMKMKPSQNVHTPPPLPHKYRYEATTPSVSLEKSNLVFHSTQTLSDGWYGSHHSPTPTLLPVETNEMTWQPPQTNKRDRYEGDHHAPAASSTHEIVLGQKATIIVEDDGDKSKGAVVEEREKNSSKEPEITENVIPSSTPSAVQNQNQTRQNKTKEMHIVLANSSSLERKKGPVSVVMPTTQTERSPNFTTSSTTLIPKIVPVEEKEKSKTVDQPLQKNDSSNFPIALGLSREPEPFSASSSEPVPKNHQPTFRHPGPTHGFGYSTLQSTQSRPIMMPHFMGTGSRPNLMSRPLDPVSAMTRLQAPPPPKKSSQNYYQTEQQTNFPFGVKIANTSPSFASSTSTISSIRPFRQSSEVSYSTVSSSTSSQFPVKSSTSNDFDKKASLLVKVLDDEVKQKLDVFTKRSDFSTSTVSLSEMTTVPSLTTDPIFSHYKQPMKPMHGPMYLIIQGHSKVKTYKPTMNKHGIPVERNEITHRIPKPISKFEQFVNENTKINTSDLERNVISKKGDEEKRKDTKSGQEDLMSSMKNGFEPFVAPTPAVTERSKQYVTTIEINN